jgi:hypothetical protein
VQTLSKLILSGIPMQICMPKIPVLVLPNTQYKKNDSDLCALQGNSEVAGWTRQFYVLQAAFADQPALLNFYTDERCDDLQGSIPLDVTFKSVPVGTLQFAVLASRVEHVLRCSDNLERER